EPWIDPGFWTRFADSWSVQPRPAATQPVNKAAIYFDVSDLVLDLFHHSTLSGIQRFQAEILRNLAAETRSPPARCAVLSKRGGLFTIDGTELLRIIEDLRADSTSRDLAGQALDHLLDAAIPCAVRAGDIFLETGAFWNVPGIGHLLQGLKGSGVRIGVFVHDILPIVAPEYFEAANTSAFVKGVFEALTFADFVLTTSEFNRTCLTERMGSAFGRVPVRLVPLGNELSRPAHDPPSLCEPVAELLEQNYVLAVGTIEVRKNPTYLLNMWKMMVRSGRPEVPRLVFVGRLGWMVEDFMRQLKACNYLGGRIVVLLATTDVELDLLYRNCLLTAFPSFLEGWGLPVGESLGHGKICLCSAAGETSGAGNLVDYIDPYNVRDGLEKLLRYLDDPERRRRREREIAENFEARTWQQVAENFLETVLSLSREASPDTRVAVIKLPDDRFLPISSDPPAVLMDQLDGRLSAELACVSGWHAPELAGIRAAQPEAAIQFRTALPAGTKINLVLRLAACFGNARIRIRTGSGAETDVALTEGLEKMAVLSCRVEEGQLVTVKLLSIGAAVTGYSSPSAVWLLSGLLYFDPTRAAAPQPRYPARLPDPVRPDRVHLRPVAVDRSRRVESLHAFLETPDSYWPFESTTVRRPPLFACEADAEAFLSGCGNSEKAPRLGAVRDSINFVRRAHPFVSTSRFSEGSVFDRKGVWRSSGYLLSAPGHHTRWRSESRHGFEVDEKLLAQAPFYEGAFLIFYNGNLHNYYHWMVEGLLSLDVLAETLGNDPNLKILLPKSMDINALIDHRGSLSDIGLGDREVVEAAADFVGVEEAVWVESDLVEAMPAAYLKSFRRRIAALYAPAQTGRGRRLLIARRGPTRTIQNLDQVQDCLSTYGFETVYTEGMSMRDQILLFQSAAFIVGAHGAALANLLWCAPETKVLEFMPAVEMRPFFWLISQKLDLVHAMQFCPTVGKSQFQSAIQVDIAKLDVLLRKLGQQ
ncbi:MAG: glycosyltransferase 61 family protein, partial [Bryobacteraceae bacterium]